MDRRLILQVMAVVLVTAAVTASVALIGYGLASQSQTDTTGDSSASLYIYAEESHRDSIKIPGMDYHWDEDQMAYIPSTDIKTINGTMKVVAPSDPAKLRVITSFDDPDSWIFINSIRLSIDEGSPVTLYQLSTEGGIVRSVVEPSDAILIDAGDHTFTLTVTYKNNMQMDPTNYDDEKMVSTILFVLDQSDPMPSL